MKEQAIQPRIALTLTGLAFGAWETADIFRIDVPAIAALFATLFIGSTAWFWQRDSARAARCLLGLFAIESAVAPSLKHTATGTKAAAFSLGILGILSAVAVLVARRCDIRSTRPSGAATASRQD